MGKKWEASKFAVNPPLPHRVVEYRSPVIIANLQTDPRIRDTEFFRDQGWISCLGVPLMVKGEVVGILGFISGKAHEFAPEEVKFLSTLADVTAITIYNSRLHEQVERQAQDLKRANEVQAEFLKLMSHQLRTSLSVITGYAGLVQDQLLGEINEKQTKAMAEVIRYSDELLTMINNILVARSIEAKGIVMENRTFRLEDLLRDLESGTSVPSDKNVELIWDYPSNLPEIWSDRDKLRRILQNLISNAFKFTHEGKVTVTARSFPQRNTVELSTADTGIGIPEEILPHLFEMFRQPDRSRGQSLGGMGLGLYFARVFAGMLGGTIEVESQPGHGSSFKLILPCASKSNEDSTEPGTAWGSLEPNWVGLVSRTG